MKPVPRGVPESSHCLFLTSLPHLSAPRLPPSSYLPQKPPSHPCSRPQHLSREIRIPSLPFWIRECPPLTPGPRPFSSKISIYSASQFTCTGPGQAGHSRKSTGIWGRKYVCHTMFQAKVLGRGGMLPGDRHSSPSRGPESSLPCPLQKRILGLRMHLGAT